jgi:hypothetical protein
MFTLRYSDILPSSTADELVSLSGQVGKFAETEHNEDGTHGDITADSVQLQGAAVGEVVDLAHDTARYHVSGGTSWTVSAASGGTPSDQVYLRFSRIGQVVFLQFYIQTSEIVGTPDFLIINIPELHAIPTRHSLGNPAVQIGGVCEWNDVQNGVDGIAEVSVLAENFAGAIPTTSIYLQRYGDDSLDAVRFRPFDASNDFWIYGSVTFFVERDNVATPFFGS